MKSCFIYGLIMIVAFLSLFLHDKVAYGTKQVRLIGVNTPELKKNCDKTPERLKVDATRLGANKDSLVTMGKLAKQYAENILPEGTPVTKAMQEVSKDYVIDEIIYAEVFIDRNAYETGEVTFHGMPYSQVKVMRRRCFGIGKSTKREDLYVLITFPERARD